MRQTTVIKNLLENATEVYNKEREVLQSMAEVYYKVCQVLQSVSSITKCDRLLLQSASGIAMCDSYYKVRVTPYKAYCVLNPFLYPHRVEIEKFFNIISNLLLHYLLEYLRNCW